MEYAAAWIWVLIPLGGMGVGAFVIWNEFSRQRKALDVLKVYAEKGVEPPQSVLDVLNRASSQGGVDRSRPSNPWASLAFFTVMGAGFGALTYWFSLSDPRAVWVFITGFGITAFVMAALAASSLVRALTSRRADGR